MYPNILQNPINSSPPPGVFHNKPGGSLDTLAQLRKSAVLQRDQKLLKRAKSKHFTGKLAIALCGLHTPMEKYYRNAIYCNHSLNQSGKTLTGKYCGTRICNTCNRIRMAKLINGYEPVLKLYSGLHFVTLTIPNVSGDDLRGELDLMYANFRKITDTLRKKKIKYAGLRKTEVTYNTKKKDFHPHIHLIVEGKEVADMILKMWLKLNPLANRKAQDIRPADDGSLKELFKYTAKVVSKINGKQVIIIEAVDTIMRALYKRRIIQPFGKLTKYIEEEIEEEDLKSDNYNIPEYETMVWSWRGEDWVNEYGELLTGYVPGELIGSIEFG